MTHFREDFSKSKISAKRVRKIIFVSLESTMYIVNCALACIKLLSNLHFMRYLHWTNGPGKVWTRETIFVKKNI